MHVEISVRRWVEARELRGEGLRLGVHQEFQLFADFPEEKKVFAICGVGSNRLEKGKGDLHAQTLPGTDPIISVFSRPEDPSVN